MLSSTTKERADLKFSNPHISRAPWLLGQKTVQSFPTYTWKCTVGWFMLPQVNTVEQSHKSNNKQRFFKIAYTEK